MKDFLQDNRANATEYNVLMDIAFGSFGACLMIAVLTPCGAWLVGKIRRWIAIHARPKRWRRGKTIVHEYTAPADLRPAELAYLYDRTFGEQELLATLFDLEQRGKLKLHATQHAGDFAITPQASVQGAELNSFERELLIHLKAAKGVARWRTLYKEIQRWESDFERRLEADLQAKGLLATPDERQVLRHILWAVGAGLSFSIIVFPVVFFEPPFAPQGTNQYTRLDRELTLGIMTLLWIVASVVLAASLWYAEHLYQRVMNTQDSTTLLRHIWPKIEGFREYITLVELDEIRFANATLRKSANHATHPYAIALNLQTNWQDRFKT